MTTKETKKNNTISLIEAKAKKEGNKMSDVEENVELQKGKEVLQEMLEDDTTGFLAITFDSEGDPRIVWSGEIDLVKAIGAVELTKNELLLKINSFTE